MKKQKAQSTPVLPSMNEQHPSLGTTDNSFLQGQIKLLYSKPNLETSFRITLNN